MKSVKEECLSKLILFGEKSLRHALRGAPYAQGNIVQKRDATLPGRRPGSMPGERWTSRRPGPQLDQNLLAQLRRGSPGLDSGSLG